MTTPSLWLAGTFTAALALGGAHPSLAQVPRVEVGGGIGGFMVDGARFFTPGSRVTVAINPRFAIESGFDSIDVERDTYETSQDWLYYVQVRQTLKSGKEPGSGFFLTYGGGGGFTHRHVQAQHYDYGRTIVDVPEFSETESWGALIGSVGVGGQRTVAKYLAIRGDAQILAMPRHVDAGPALRLTAGVTVPIGGYKR